MKFNQSQEYLKHPEAKFNNAIRAGCLRNNETKRFRSVAYEREISFYI